MNKNYVKMYKPKLTSFIFENKILISIGFIGPILIILTTWKYGIGITSDSITYIGCAENLLSGNGFMHAIHLATQNLGEKNYYHEWAPLLPVFLSGFMFLGFSPETGALILNCFSSFFIALVVLILLRKFKMNDFFVLSGISLSIFSVPIFIDLTSLMSEMPFNFFTILSLVFLICYLKEQKLYFFFLSILFTSFACLCRYIGITIIITSVVLLLYCNKGNNHIWYNITIIDPCISCKKLY